VSSCFEVYEGFPAMILLDIVVLCGTRDLLAGHELDVEPPTMADSRTAGDDAKK
jgi:hypothetical protein